MTTVATPTEKDKACGCKRDAVETGIASSAKTDDKVRTCYTASVFDAKNKVKLVVTKKMCNIRIEFPWIPPPGPNGATVNLINFPEGVMWNEIRISSTDGTPLAYSRVLPYSSPYGMCKDKKVSIVVEPDGATGIFRGESTTPDGRHIIMVEQSGGHVLLFDIEKVTAIRFDPTPIGVYTEGVVRFTLPPGCQPTVVLTTNMVTFSDFWEMHVQPAVGRAELFHKVVFANKTTAEIAAESVTFIDEEAKPEKARSLEESYVVLESLGSEKTPPMTQTSSKKIMYTRDTESVIRPHEVEVFSVFDQMVLTCTVNVVTILGDYFCAPRTDEKVSCEMEVLGCSKHISEGTVMHVIDCASGATLARCAMKGKYIPDGDGSKSHFFVGMGVSLDVIATVSESVREQVKAPPGWRKGNPPEHIYEKIEVRNMTEKKSGLLVKVSQGASTHAVSISEKKSGRTFDFSKDDDVFAIMIDARESLLFQVTAKARI